MAQAKHHHEQETILAERCEASADLVERAEAALAEALDVIEEAERVVSTRKMLHVKIMGQLRKHGRIPV